MATVNTREQRMELVSGHDWFRDGEPKEVLIRYYSCPFPVPDEDNFLPPIGTDIFLYDRPFRAVLCDIEGQEYPTVYHSFIRSPQGLQLLGEKVIRALPSSKYVLVSTPLRSGSREDELKKSMATMDQFVGLLRMTTGNGFLRAIVREEILSILDAKMTAISKLIPVPHISEGPFLGSQNWSEIQEMIKAGSQLEGENKNRFTLSCQLFEEGARAEVPAKFFLYWVSMEVLCDTHDAFEISRTLSRAYNKPKEFIQNELGFKKLIRLRQDLFHQGQPHDLPLDVERYIQVVFLDLLRSKLQMICKNCIEAYIESGFNTDRLDRELGRKVTQILKHND